jgi:hypothetical protein
MSQKSYQEVMAALKPQEVPQELPEEIPEERAAFREPPQPGSYRFRAPQAIESCFDTVEVAQKDAEGKPVLDAAQKPVTYQRINVIFDGPNALVITQSPSDKTTGEPFTTRISNIERARYSGRTMVGKVSDLTYLLRAKAPEQRPRTNAEFIQLCLKVLPSAEFGADVEWQGFCNPKKDAYFAFPSADGSETIYEPGRDEGAAENKQGCNTRTYQGDWPHDASGYAPRVQCKCGAWVRPFAQLVRFKA